METIWIRFIFQPVDLYEGGEMGVVVDWHPKLNCYQNVVPVFLKILWFCYVCFLFFFLTGDPVVRVFSR